MTDKPCGHDARFLISKDGGALFCAICEYLATKEREQELENLILWRACEIVPEAA